MERQTEIFWSFVPLPGRWRLALMQTSNGELTDNRLEEWKTARDVLTKINERIHDLRKYGFSVVTTLLTISGFLSTTGTTPVGDQVRVAGKTTNTPPIFSFIYM